MANTRPLAAAITMLALGGEVVAGCGIPEVGSPDAAQGSAVQEPQQAEELQGLAAAGARRRGIPPEYRVTPHGYVHPSCIVKIGSDETLRRTGVIEGRSGGRRSLQRCQFSRFDKHGQAVVEQTAPPPQANGWIASASAASVGPLDWISASWTVPSAPASAGTQTVYVFPGLEPAATGDTILQPVLAWNGFNDGRWTLASWNCCRNGNVLHSEPIPVNPSETVSGYVSGSNCGADGVCSHWVVQAMTASGLPTTLNTESYGQVLDWAFGAALEAYGVDSCAQYPADGALKFDGIAVHQVNGAYVTPAWSPSAYSVSPSCLTGVDATSIPGAVSMTWWPAANPLPSPPSQCGYLRPGEGLVAGQVLASCDGRFALSIQGSDGRLVLSQGGVGTIWRAHSPGGYSAVMQGDGNFAVYGRTSRVWATNTSGRTGAYLVLQDDGNLVLRSAAGRRLWTSNTCCR